MGLNRNDPLNAESEAWAVERWLDQLPGHSAQVSSSRYQFKAQFSHLLQILEILAVHSHITRSDF
jgi:hypothetical protein